MCPLVVLCFFGAFIFNTTLVGSIDAERVRLQLLASSQSIVSHEKLNSWDFDVLDYSHEQLNEVSTLNKIHMQTH